MMALGMRSTIAFDTTNHRCYNMSQRLEGLQGSPSPLEADEDGVAVLTSGAVFLILGFVMACVPSMLATVLAHLNDEDKLAIGPFSTLHS